MTRKPVRSPGAAKAYIPARRDIFWIDLNPQAGREQAGRRPCLVLSPADYNGKTGLAVVCPITGQAKGYPFEVALPFGLATTGVVLSDHIKNLDWRVRRAEFREQVPESVVREVLDMATALLDPSDQAPEREDADKG
jgi:mRNA interferase MazF